MLVIKSKYTILFTLLHFTCCSVFFNWYSIKIKKKIYMVGLHKNNLVNFDTSVALFIIINVRRIKVKFNSTRSHNKSGFFLYIISFCCSMITGVIRYIQRRKCLSPSLHNEHTNHNLLQIQRNIFELIRQISWVSLIVLFFPLFVSDKILRGNFNYFFRFPN